MDADALARLLAFHLAGEQLEDSNGLPGTDMLLTNGGPTANSFLLWNGNGGDLFMVTVTKCPEA